ncbi:hypothetical protein MM1218R_05492 [Mycobacterium marinum]|nr:hypothetical protein MM1218R_05492 [Mycobacterium marinum]RFZ01415.1 hypothetical protein DE4381_05436 [Mycobacterium marinum]RFZ11383.1 hypothetical protein VIMS_03296 [Mycobacterium marinum]
MRACKFQNQLLKYVTEESCMNCEIDYNLHSQNALAAAFFRHARSGVVSTRSWRGIGSLRIQDASAKALASSPAT